MYPKKIEDLLSGKIKPATRGKKTPSCSVMTETLEINDNWKVTKNFEKRVLNWLYSKKNFNIEKVYALNKMLIDGALEMSDGRMVLLESKFALNWFTSCNARIEFQRFMAGRLYERLSGNKIPSNALIIFDHFSGDWDKKTKSRKCKNGWNFFYEEENVLREVSSLPIDISQLTTRGLKNPLATIR